MSNNDYMYAPHCAKCGTRVGAPRLVPEDYRPVRTLCFICPEGAKQEPMSDDKFEVLQALIKSGEVDRRARQLAAQLAHRMFEQPSYRLGDELPLTEEDF